MISLSNKKISNLIFWIIIGYIFIRPIICDQIFFYLDVSINLIFFISAFIMIKINHSVNYKNNNIQIFTLVFFISLIFAFVVSKNYLNSLITIPKYFSAAILFYLICIAGKKNKNQLIITLLLSAILVCLLSLRVLFISSKYVKAYLSSHNINYPFAFDYLERNRAFAPFISPNLLACYLAMIIFLSLGIVLQYLKEKRKVLMLFLTILGIGLFSYVFFLTQSFGAWLIFFIVMLLFFYATKFINTKAIAIIILMLIIIGTIFNLRIDKSKPHTQLLFSAEKRLSYWKETLNLIKHYPISGLGIGNFNLRETRNAHNSYLQIWAETGLFGLLSWLGIITVFIRSGIKLILTKQLSNYRLGIFLAGIYFILHNFIESALFFYQVAFLWWVILALYSSDEPLSFST